MKITANMATMPERVNIALKTIKSLIDQVDEFRVYLNDFKEIPEAFIQDKVLLLSGPDLKSTGKLKMALNPNEYYFTVDDDLEYPTTYVKDMINFLNKYNDNIIVSLHGKIMRPTINRYFNSYKATFHCLQTEKTHEVNIIGNGVALWNTNVFKMDYKKYSCNFCDDITVSLSAEKQNISKFVMGHNQNYLKYNKPSNQTLFDKYHINDIEQTKLVKTIKWKNL